MDVSQYITADNVKFYIYTVVDNFSRKILAYDYSKKLSAAIRVKSLRRAVEEQFGVSLNEDKKDTKINETNEKKPSLNLIVDGGSENNNKTVHNFIKDCHINIDKKIALKDVTYSNNMVENPFKTMKSKYFRWKEIFENTFPQELYHFLWTLILSVLIMPTNFIHPMKFISILKSKEQDLILLKLDKRGSKLIEIIVAKPLRKLRNHNLTVIKN